MSTTPKTIATVAQEQGAIVLPRWFLWLMSTVGISFVPLSVGAIGWAWSVNSNLTEINVSLRHMREDNGDTERKLELLDQEVEAHLRDPAIHRYELERIRADMQRLADRVEILEGEE